MTMGDETPVSSLVLPVLLRPILCQLERRDVTATQTLRAAISKVEASYPGFTYDFVVGIMRRGDLGINMNESILRLQGAASDLDVVEYRLIRSEDAFQDLNKKSSSLKKILSRIPDEITDRKTFLETIKEIASAIKKLLDAVSEVCAYIPGTAGKQALEQRKREFVKYSKRFSNTLKEYFKEGHVQLALGLSKSNLGGMADLEDISVQDGRGLIDQSDYDHREKQVRVSDGEESPLMNWEYKKVTFHGVSVVSAGKEILRFRTESARKSTQKQ